MNNFDDLKDWTTKYIGDPEIGKYKKLYYFKNNRAPTVQIRSKLAQKLAGYALIEKDLKSVSKWLERLDGFHKSSGDHKRSKWYFSDKNEEDYNLCLGLFVASLTFYAKCFTKCEGRKVKLNKNNIDSTYRDAHGFIIQLRNNMAAHSGADNFEEARVVLVINPKKKYLNESPYLVREVLQAESLVSGSEENYNFIKLVDHVHSYVVKKLDELHDNIFKNEINPKGTEYWYKKGKKS